MAKHAKQRFSYLRALHERKRLYGGKSGNGVAGLRRAAPFDQYGSQSDPGEKLDERRIRGGEATVSHQPLYPMNRIYSITLTLGGRCPNEEVELRSFRYRPLRLIRLRGDPFRERLVLKALVLLLWRALHPLRTLAPGAAVPLLRREGC
jgi:hypothetical protein